MANRAAMDAVKREAEASRKDQIEELNVKHSEEKGLYIFLSVRNFPMNVSKWVDVFLNVYLEI